MDYSIKVNRISRNLWATKKPLLSHIDVELTERCNNACIHCYINQPEHDASCKKREMSTPFVKNILKQSATMGCVSVRFTGSEPLLRGDFAELYVFARRLGLLVVLFTNARLITEELCLLFSRMPPGVPVSVTVYGMHASSYDSVTGRPGSFEEFWTGVSLLKQFKIPFTVKQSLLPQNRAEIHEFVAFAATLSDMKGIKPGYSMNFDLRARRDNPVKNQYIKTLRISPEETLSILTRESDVFLNEMRQFAEKFLVPPGNLLFNCGAGLSTCVDAYGNAQMCMLLRHPETVHPLINEAQKENDLGLKTGTIEFALNEFFPKVRQTQATNPDYLQRCALCFLKGICEQCPAKSWEEHGTLDTPVEYLCEVAHAQAEYLGLLKPDEKSWQLPRKVWETRLAEFTSPTTI